MRATESIQHIFSELYHAPENLRAGYFKLKVMELFLFLGSPEITARGEERPYVDRTQVEQIKSVRQYLVEHLDRRITLQELSQTFSFPLTSMKKCFRYMGPPSMPTCSLTASTQRRGFCGKRSWM